MPRARLRCCPPSTCTRFTRTGKSWPLTMSVWPSPRENMWPSWVRRAAANRRCLTCWGPLTSPTRARSFSRGCPCLRQPSLARLRSRKIGFVFQSFHLLPTLTALENVQVPMFGGPLSASGRAKKASELLETVGMSHRARHIPTRLSVGERQRVALARALANDPVLLLADEPTGNLDSRSAALVLDLFSSLNRDRGLTLVIVTHSPDLARRCGRVLWMTDGRLVKDERNSDAEGPAPVWEPAAMPSPLS